jgi:hypothetical protein
VVVLEPLTLKFSNNKMMMLYLENIFLQVNVLVNSINRKIETI